MVAHILLFAIWILGGNATEYNSRRFNATKTLHVAQNLGILGCVCSSVCGSTANPCGAAQLWVMDCPLNDSLVDASSRTGVACFYSARPIVEHRYSTLMSSVLKIFSSQEPVNAHRRF